MRVLTLGFTILVAAGLAIALAAHALPRAVASYNHSLAKPIMENFENNGVVPTESQFVLVEQAYGLALDWNDNPQIFRELAASQALRGLVTLAARQDGERLFSSARNSLQKSLQRNPTSHVSWMIFAELAMIERDADRAAAYLARSYQFGPLDFDNGLSRLGVSLELLPLFDQATVNAIVRETAALAALDYRNLALIAVEVGRADTVRAMLVGAGAEAALVDAFVSEARKLIGAN